MAKAVKQVRTTKKAATTVVARSGANAGSKAGANAGAKVSAKTASATATAAGKPAPRARAKTRRGARTAQEAAAPAAQLMSNLDLYFQEVKAYSLLTRDEECELARGIHANDNESLHKLVKANLRFVVSIAKEYAHYGVPL